MAYSPVPAAQPFLVQVPELRDAAQQIHAKPQVFDKPQIHTVTTVAAAGSASTDAAAISDAGSGLVLVTAANGTKGVILPAAPIGTAISLFNNSASALKVYPHAGGDINNGTTDASVNMSANTRGMFMLADALTWASTYS